MVEAVVFDLDGVLIQSEEVWDRVRRDLARESGRPWPDEATPAMMGMSSPEWSRYMHDEVGIGASPAEINVAVVRGVTGTYRTELPWIPGAREAVRRVGERWTLGLATSSNREIVDLVLELGGLGGCFAVTVSSEEVAAGKPSPDVYLEAARRLGAPPAACVAVEDSTNGLRAAASAGMGVIALPNPAHPPTPEALGLAGVVLDSADGLTPEAVEAAAGSAGRDGT
jgi:HAD superfamily hydrolase (TIGR01509 family)